MVVALSHCRLPNDRLLAASAPEIDLVLGGHDHDYVVEDVAHATGFGTTLLVKSGARTAPLRRAGCLHMHHKAMRLLRSMHAIMLVGLSVCT